MTPLGCMHVAEPHVEIEALANQRLQGSNATFAHAVLSGLLEAPDGLFIASEDLWETVKPTPALFLCGVWTRQ